MTDFLDLLFRGGAPAPLLIGLLLLAGFIAIVSLIFTSRNVAVDLGVPHFVLGFVAALLGVFLIGGFWAYWVPVIIAVAYISKYLFNIPKSRRR
jgi:hypothetical protein